MVNTPRIDNTLYTILFLYICICILLLSLKVIKLFVLFYFFISIIYTGKISYLMSFLLFGTTLIDMFILSLTKQEKEMLKSSWSTDLIDKYERIYKQRTELFITGFSIGLILSWIIKYVGIRYNWNSIQIILAMFIMFVISIMGIYFLANPDKMSKYLKTHEEIQTLDMIQEKMRWRYMIAILFVICVFPLAIYYELQEEGIKQFLQDEEYYWSGSKYYEPITKLKIIKYKNKK